MELKEIYEQVYQRMLKDSGFRCTCDEVIRETEFHQAEGHYTHCMLHQVTRAIRITADVIGKGQKTEDTDTHSVPKGI